MRPVTYPVFTVVVFAGSPTSNHLTEAYRRTFEDQAAAERYARVTTTQARLNAAQAKAYIPPCASVFEDSPSRGLGRCVAERTSRARAKYLASLEREPAAQV